MANVATGGTRSRCGSELPAKRCRYLFIGERRPVGLLRVHSPPSHFLSLSITVSLSLILYTLTKRPPYAGHLVRTSSSGVSFTCHHQSIENSLARHRHRGRVDDNNIFYLTQSKYTTLSPQSTCYSMLEISSRERERRPCLIVFKHWRVSSPRRTDRQNTANLMNCYLKSSDDALF